jgi:transposase
MILQVKIRRCVSDEKYLSERIYEYSSCNLKIDQDLNAALNLKQYAIKSLQVNRVSSDSVI